jgi:hypothetical protein
LDAGVGQALEQRARVALDPVNEGATVAVALADERLA